jgi:hypothetical protein
MEGNTARQFPGVTVLISLPALYDLNREPGEVEYIHLSLSRSLIH